MASCATNQPPTDGGHDKNSLQCSGRGMDTVVAQWARKWNPFSVIMRGLLLEIPLLYTCKRRGKRWIKMMMTIQHGGGGNVGLILVAICSSHSCDDDGTDTVRSMSKGRLAAGNGMVFGNLWLSFLSAYMAGCTHTRSLMLLVSARLSFLHKWFRNLPTFFLLFSPWEEAKKKQEKEILPAARCHQNDGLLQKCWGQKGKILFPVPISFSELSHK